VVEKDKSSGSSVNSGGGMPGTSREGGGQPEPSGVVRRKPLDITIASETSSRPLYEFSKNRGECR